MERAREAIRVAAREALQWAETVEQFRPVEWARVAGKLATVEPPEVFTASWGVIATL